MEKQRNSGSWITTSFTLMALGLFVWCRPALAAEPINIGFTTDFSGVTASLTMVEAPVVEMVVKEVNAAGGINGRPIKLIIQDNASDPAKAIGNVKMFKEQYHTPAIIAGVTSSVNLALKDWAEKNHISIISADPQSDALWQKTGKSWFFRTAPPASVLVDATLARLKKLGYTKVAFEGSTLAWGTDTLATVKERAPVYGITIVAAVQAEPKTKDLTIQAKQLQESGAQALICAEYEAETVVLARAMNSVGWKPHVIHTSPANINASISLSSPEMFEGWETVATADSTKPLVEKIWKETEAYTGKKIDHDEKAIRQYDAINLLIAALKASGNPDDPTAIRDAYYKLDNYERGLGQAGGKGGFAVGINHTVTPDDVVIYSLKAGKMVALS
jgi:branched-chain amino acid transport system substrate-binding protein